MTTNDDKTKSGWVRISNGFDVELRHGIPVRLSDNGKGVPGDTDAVRGEIRNLTGMTVSVGGWEAGEGKGEQEAPLRVAGSQLGEVLRRLGLASAALFVGRFHKAIDVDVMDWDQSEYSSDFNEALEYCGLDRHEVNKSEHFDAYVEIMHQESRRLMDEGIDPIVDAE